MHLMGLDAYCPSVTIVVPITLRRKAGYDLRSRCFEIVRTYYGGKTGLSSVYRFSGRVVLQPVHFLFLRRKLHSVISVARFAFFRISRSVADLPNLGSVMACLVRGRYNTVFPNGSCGSPLRSHPVALKISRVEGLAYADRKRREGSRGQRHASVG